ncbi:MAG: hypothetical protein RIC16_13435 [Rhodospirillales bacterium]
MTIAYAARLCLAVVLVIYLVLQPNPGMSGSDRHIGAGSAPGLADDHREIVLSPALRQNSDNRIRLIVPDKCAEAGERELRRMASESELEEAYAFLPARCLWIELGSDETATGVRPDATLVLSLISRHEPVVVYHTHVRSHTESSGGFPAYRDLIGTILIGGDLPLTEHRPIIHRAVTHEGIFEYSLTLTPDIVDFIQALGDSGLDGFVSQNLAYLFVSAEYEKAYYEAVRYCTRLGDGTNLIDSGCFPVSSHPFVLNFIRAVDAD